VVGSVWAQTRLLDRAFALRRIWREIAWLVAGEVVGAIGALVSVRLLTSNLDPEEYGRLALGLTLATLVAQTLLGPLANACERFFATAVEQRRVTELFWAIRRITVAASLVSVVIGTVAVLVLWVAGQSDWALLAGAGFAFALLSGWERILDGLQNAARARAIVAWHQALRQWVRPALAVMLVALLARTGAVALAGFGVASAGVLASQLTLSRRSFNGRLDGPVDRTLARSEQIRLLSYAAPFSAWGLFTWLQLSSDRWSLELVGTSHEVGLYAVLLQIGMYPLTLVGTVFSQFAGPIVFARVGDATDPRRLQEGFQITLRLVAGFVAFSMAAIAASILLSGPVFELLAASAYREASGLMPVAMAAGAVFNIGQLVSLLPMAAGDSRALLPAKIVTALVSVPMYLVGAAQAGIQGILVASLLMAVVYAAWTVAIGARVMRRVTT
jgi:O-antigen/teichoic acid export membrane protein